MDSPERASRLARQDPVALGARLRAARRAVHLNQADVAEQVGISISYVSRLEAGTRRCDFDLLVRLARRLQVTIEALLDEPPAPSRAREVASPRPPELDFAVVALEMGEAQTALDLAAKVDLDESAPDAVHRALILLQGRSLEGLGRLAEAIEVLEQIKLPGPDPVSDAFVAIALSRVYRESGEVTRAVRVGESALSSLEAAGLSGRDESVQLAVTVAAAYFEQGDRQYALRLCRRTLAAAEKTGTPRARASAYWNVAIMDLERGQSESAVQLARRALALLGEGQDERNLGRLRIELGLMELRLNPPDLDAARGHLGEAQSLLAGSSGGQVDLLRIRFGFARSHLLGGDLSAARDDALQIPERLQGSSPQLEAQAYVVAGEASVGLGEPEPARGYFLQAVGLLAGMDDARSVAQLWFDLGRRLQAVGDTESAIDAFQRAAVAAGLNLDVTAPASLEWAADPPSS